MSKECPYPDISGVTTCFVDEMFSEWGCEVCQKACSKKRPALFEMARLSTIDAVGELELPRELQIVVEALREQGIAINEYDDTYPRVPHLNILQLLKNREK